MSTKHVNGVKPHSQTLSHITSYPLISDVLGIYQKNTLGAKTIELYNNLYKTFAEPVMPYLQTPYSIAAPYLEKADHLGNSTLDWTDNHFPIVKETNLGSLKDKAFETAHFPFKLAGQTKDYVFTTYNDEYSKVGGQGVVKTGKAVFSTELHIASDAYKKLIEMLGPRGKDFDEKARDLYSNGGAKAGQLRDTLHKTASDYSKAGQDKFEELKKGSMKNADSAKQTAHHKTQEAKHKADQATK